MTKHFCGRGEADNEAPLSGDSQPHKIHYSLRWNPSAINKKRWEKAAAVEACRIARALGCPIHQRFAERAAGGLTHGAMSSAAPPGSWALYPKTPDSPDGRKHLAKMMAEQSSHKPAAFTWDSCRNTHHLQKAHPLELAPISKGWAGTEMAETQCHHQTPFRK